MLIEMEVGWVGGLGKRWREGELDQQLLRGSMYVARVGLTH
jgi:hypothetical protein